MPTEAKRESVADLVDRIKRSTIAIATDFSGLSVNQLTELRRRLREQGVEYRVVKNRLAARAAAEAGVEPFSERVEGAAGRVFGVCEPEGAAQGVRPAPKETRSSLRIRNGIMGGEVLTAAQVSTIAALPPRQELLAMLLRQLNAPVAGLANVLAGPIRGLAIVLGRRVEQMTGSA